MFFNSEQRDQWAQFYSNNFVELQGPASSQGRKIFVSKDAAKRLASLIDNRSKDFNLLYITRQLFSLKDVGHLNSLISKAAPTSRKLVFEGGEIQYSIWKGHVYIANVSIKANFRVEKGKKTVPAGVYRASKDRISKEWSVTDTKGNVSRRSVVNTKHLAINGFCDDIQDAAGYMPAFIEYGYGDQTLSGGIYSLFFNPSQGFASADWRCIQESAGVGSHSSSLLAATLEQSAGNPICLTVHERGHALLKDALRKVCAKNIKLDSFTVFYANPTHNLELVDKWRERTGIKLAPKPPLINTLSAHQSLVAGNGISGAVVAARAQPENSLASFVNAGIQLWGLQGLTAIGGSLSLTAAVSWTSGALPFALGLAPELNKKIINNPGIAVQEGLKATRKAVKNTGQLVWDPIHKMMVRG